MRAEIFTPYHSGSKFRSKRIVASDNTVKAPRKAGSPAGLPPFSVRFYATIGDFSSKENCFSAAINHRYHIWKCMRPAGFASNGFQLSLACSLFIFGRIYSTRYCDDSSCWMYVFEKVNQVVQRDFNCELYS